MDLLAEKIERREEFLRCPTEEDEGDGDGEGRGGDDGDGNGA